MATQGMVTVQQRGKVIMKVIAGIDGDKAQALATLMLDAWPMTVDAVYHMALEIGFGSPESLVIMTANTVRFDGDEDLHPRYRDTFQEPRFNPRWESGICDHIAIVNIENAKAGDASY